MRYLLVGLLLLAGCSPTQVPTDSPSAVAPSGVTTTPTPEPTPTCSPIGGTPSPCSPDEYAKVEAQNKLVNEAIAVYKRWTKERTRLYRTGGTNTVTPEMSATTAGEAQSSALGIFKDLKAAGVRAQSGSLRVIAVGPIVAEGTPSDGVVIRACVDGTSLKFVREGKSVNTGVKFEEDITFRSINGGLRMWSVASESVKSCAA